MKTIWIIEKKDHHGEFQPANVGLFFSRESCIETLEKLALIEPVLKGRLRAMLYVKRENRS